MFSIVATAHGFASGGKDGIVRIWNWAYKPFPVNGQERNEIRVGVNVRCIAAATTPEGLSLTQLMVSVREMVMMKDDSDDNDIVVVVVVVVCCLLLLLLPSFLCKFDCKH